MNKSFLLCPAWWLIVRLSVPAHATDLVLWDFEDAPLNQQYQDSNPEGYSAKVADNDVLVSRLTLSGEPATSTKSKIRDKAEMLGGGGDQNLDTGGWNEGVDLTRYLEFTMQVSPGLALNLSTLSLQQSANEDGKVPDSLTVRIRIGNGPFQTLGKAFPVPHDEGVPAVDPADHLLTLGLAHAALQGVTQTLTFRLHPHGGSRNTGKWRLDDLKVTGTIVASPLEPGTTELDGSQIPWQGPHGKVYASRILNDGQPILSRQEFVDLGVASEGNNLNGPSLVKLPDWLPAAQRADPGARYYLYFADHGGHYIRMAWAEELEGPWTLYRTGSAIPKGSRGVLDMGADREITPGNGLRLHSHIASPDVILDEENQQFLLFFHAPTNLPGPSPLPAWTGGSSQSQRSFVAVSSTGLDFHAGVKPVSLGLFYFQVFRVGGRLHAFSNRGLLYRAPLNQDPFDPPSGFDYRLDYWEWEPGPSDMLYTWLQTATQGVEEPRHLGFLKQTDGVRVFFSQVNGTPERIQAVDLSFHQSEDWDDWTLSPETPLEIYRPTTAWEGMENPDLGPSQNGPASNGEHALRDPELYQEDGKTYLLYSGGGEDALGLVKLEALPQGIHVGPPRPASVSGYWDIPIRIGLPEVTGLGVVMAPDLAEMFQTPEQAFLLSSPDQGMRMRLPVPGEAGASFFAAEADLP